MRQSNMNLTDDQKDEVLNPGYYQAYLKCVMAQLHVPHWIRRGLILYLTIMRRVFECDERQTDAFVQVMSEPHAPRMNQIQTSLVDFLGDRLSVLQRMVSDDGPHPRSVKRILYHRFKNDRQLRDVLIESGAVIISSGLRLTVSNTKEEFMHELKKNSVGFQLDWKELSSLIVVERDSLTLTSTGEDC